ncbi:MAG: hypothetical protein DIU79_16985 [Actinobacteria bacterium]|nr:MAG: hypothetical protein DIU79_16985 [Actinomycetota bacterium]
MEATFTLPNFGRKGRVMSFTELSFLERPAVTAAEIMRHCGVARNTITHWMKRGWLKPIGRLGQTLLFRPVDALNADAQARRDARRSHRRRPIDGTAAA